MRKLFNNHDKKRINLGKDGMRLSFAPLPSSTSYNNIEKLFEEFEIQCNQMNLALTWESYKRLTSRVRLCKIQEIEETLFENSTELTN